MKFGFKEKKRMLLALVAVIGMGITVSLLLRVDMGTDPYTCLNKGASTKLGMTLGNWQALLNTVLLLIVLKSDKSQIGWGTVFNVFLVGYTSDFTTWLTDKIVSPEVFGVIYIRIIVMIVGIVMFVFSASLYMSAGMGVSPYDAIIFVVANKMKKVPFRISRICMDALGCVIGYALGSTVGIVTILVVLTLGPVLQYMKEKIDKIL